MRMLAAVMPSAGTIEVADFAVPAPAADEALIKMETAAICGSDVHVLFEGFARPDAIGRPGYPGHEGVGEVIESRTARFPVGTQVLTVPPGWYGGCFAQYQVVHEKWLLPLPPGGDRQRLLMAQQLGTTIYALRKFWPGQAASAATVLGAGSAGLFFVQQLKRRGFEQIIVADLEPGRLAIARRLGATATVLGSADSVVEATMAATDGAGADLVIEAAGYDETRIQAVGCVRKHGKIGYFGYPERYGLSPFPFERAYRKAVTIDFTIDTALEPGLRSFAEAIIAVDRGDIDVTYSLTDVFPLTQIAIALQLAREHGAVKIRVDLTGSDGSGLAGSDPIRSR
jgi:L-iditol 2-dehydrogenase